MDGVWINASQHEEPISGCHCSGFAGYKLSRCRVVQLEINEVNEHLIKKSDEYSHNIIIKFTNKKKSN